MDTLDRIEILIIEKGWSKSEFFRRLDMSTNVFGEWRRGKHKSYQKHMPRIAELLDTSVDYLVCNTDDPSPPSGQKKDEEIALIREALQGSVYMDIVKDMNRDERREFAKKFVKFVNENRYTLELIRDTIDKPDRNNN